MMTSEKIFVPVIKRQNIDSGYAWIVLTAAYLGLLIHTVTMYMNGVIYLALLQHFRESVTKTSLVVTLSSSILCFGSTGHGFIVAGCLCATGFYFDRHRNITISLCYIIPGAGLFISTPLAISVFEKFGISCLFLTCASLTAQVCVIGVISKPSEIELELQQQRNTKLNSKLSNGLLKNTGGMDLLKHKSFLCVLFTNIAWGFSLITCTTHIPNYISVSGDNDGDIERVMMILAISNTLGRATGILVINCYDIFSLHVNMASFLLSAILSMTFPLYSKSTFGIYGFAVQAAYCVGIPNSMMTHIPTKFVGISRLSDANGLSFFFFGIGFGSGPFVTGAVSLVGSILGLVAQRLDSKDINQQHKTPITLEIEE